MDLSVRRLGFGAPHCPVCPMFLGQSVPVVRTAKGYGLFCEVCALGQGPVVLHVSDSRRLKLHVDEPATADAPNEEE